MELSNVSNIGNFSSIDTNLINTLPPELISRLGDLIFVLKAVGILVIAYILFWIMGSVMNYIRHRKINKIYDKVNEIDRKLDILLKDRNKKK